MESCEFVWEQQSSGRPVLSPAPHMHSRSKEDQETSKEVAHHVIGRQAGRGFSLLAWGHLGASPKLLMHFLVLSAAFAYLGECVQGLGKVLSPEESPADLGGHALSGLQCTRLFLANS